MRPHADLAFVPARKLTGYLLHVRHADGGPKALYFRAHGYDEGSADALDAGLLHIARTGRVVDQRETGYGISYGVSGVLHTPRGTALRVRTVRVLADGERRPQFVTAYPENRL
jgi:hypothetical protein